MLMLTYGGTCRRINLKGCNPGLEANGGRVKWEGELNANFPKGAPLEATSGWDTCKGMRLSLIGELGVAEEAHNRRDGLEAG